jgi:hypothetical protein
MAYTTLASVRSYLKFDASETTDDSVISGLIPYAQKLIDVFVGYSFEASVDTTRYFNAEDDIKLASAKTLYRGLRDTLYFDTWLAQLTSVTFVNTTLQSGDYILNPTNQAPYYSLTILPSSPRFWDYEDDPQNAIAVTGRWAYSITVPADIAQICLELVAYLHNQRFTVQGESGVSADGTVMRIPTNLLTLLMPYRKVASWR